MDDLLPLDSAHRVFGTSHPRIDGRAKVTGRALYPSDEPVAAPAYAFLVTSAIARGRIAGFDLDEARSLDGVIDILTHENVGGEARPPEQQAGGETTTTMENDRIWHDGQIIGVVVAETYEIARDAAYRIFVHYESEAPSATFDSPGVEEERREPGEHEDYEVGNAEGALGEAEATVDEWYETPTQHHNPIELFTTTCIWENDRLTVLEPSQFVYGMRGNIAGQFGLDPGKVRGVSKYVGGAFGSKGGLTARTAWIAIAARRINRPVKLVATRDQGFTIVTYRAETRHHLQLGATREGRLVALRHEGWELTSRPSQYNVSGTETTARVYACPNILTRVNIVHADRNTPGFMRAPPDTPYMFPLESAMDELAWKLEIDPIELRRLNEPGRDPVNGNAWSSRNLMACFEEGAKRFGWPSPRPAPGTRWDGDWRVGLGCASAAYPSNIAATAARVHLRADGHARVEIAGHDIGTGAYTVAAMTVADRLGVEVGKVDVAMGDTSLPPASLAAGSSHTASITHAIALACDDLRRRLIQTSITSDEGPLAGRGFEAVDLYGGRLVADDGGEESLEDAANRLSRGAVEAYGEYIPKGLPPEAMDKLYSGKPPIWRGQQRKDVTAYGFGAQFVEVRVHARTGEIRVPRMLGVFSCGTIVNPLTAHSQFMGGMIWGIGAALLEKTEIDLRHASYVNDNISEYHIPVNADVGTVEVVMLPERDVAVNPLGIKGIGEIGIVGVNAAIANAVFHATGRRIRKLPIRIEDMI
ncbi:xanthine dehydrogenase family protein molybdopterin-binding subunit [Aureimonas leprariae]|uniref:Xanthine dehydrogenase family protein molybdopterin-binding subunit n=1 Tax=Plantimonas leprariae TaxID=2615207 RepID=A0A7V7TUS1_9HYPH|nr:xanthine dehydrogenase family protein molybdopterin-binding subunit [Aureimonas leprariae]KAB0676216.1 xanthine dehydrogenase family protein molybdopterin-binding subunit [Aureimonas leprariae]